MTLFICCLESPTTDDGFRWTNWRRSFMRLPITDIFKPVPECSSAVSTVNENNCDFTYNILPAPLSGKHT